MKKCPKCGGITGYKFMLRGRLQSRKWKIPFLPDAQGIRCRDCEGRI